MLATTTLELSALRRNAAPIASSVHLDDIRPVCEAHPFITVGAEYLKSLCEDAHRGQRVSKHDPRLRVPNGEDVAPIAMDDAIFVDEDIASLVIVDAEGPGETGELSPERVAA